MVWVSIRGQSRKGEILEGAEDDIRATYYILAFQREFNDDEAELRWKVVDMMVVGGELKTYVGACISVTLLFCALTPPRSAVIVMSLVHKRSGIFLYILEIVSSSFTAQH